MSHLLAFRYSFATLDLDSLFSFSIFNFCISRKCLKNNYFDIFLSVSTNSSAKGSDSDATSASVSAVAVESRHRSFSDCPTLPPIGSNRINKRGPQTTSANSNTKNFNPCTSGIADHYREEMEREIHQYSSGTYALPPIQTRDDYYPSSGSMSHRGTSSRRYSLDVKTTLPSHYTGGLLSLQTCSHPIYTASPPLASGWYKGEREGEGSRSNGREMDGNRERDSRSMEVVTRDDNDQSCNSSHSCTPTSYQYNDTTSASTTTTVESALFPPLINTGNSNPLLRHTVSNGVDGAGGYGIYSSSAATTPSTNYSTPDMTPLHSPQRF